MNARAISRVCAVGLLATSCLAAPLADAATRRPSSRGGAAPPATPDILANATNRVPACVTPEHLMRTLAERNGRLDERFKTIAAHYKKHGEALGVRWDYAFYQMVLETNHLAFTGDVRARQNNFAGLGATGGGVQGEVFPDVSTGVLAQLQHLLAYAGERVEKPVAKRTAENQDDIIAKSRRLGRAVRFGDLTNRWAADRNYAHSINAVAERFREAACSGKGEVVAAATSVPLLSAAEAKATRDAGKPGGPARSAGDRVAPATLGAMTAANCAVQAASYGGNVTLLIRAASPKGVTFTALGVDGKSEQSMADSFIRTHAAGGEIAGRFNSRDEAIAHAYGRCDSGKP